MKSNFHVDLPPHWVLSSVRPPAAALLLPPETNNAGCILLNAAMTDVVLVKCWKGNSRGLPKGKINQDESAFDAAMREVRHLLQLRCLLRIVR